MPNLRMSHEITTESFTEKNDLVLDSVVLAAAALKRDARHKEASKILSAIGLGKVGKCLITDFIIAEALTLVRFSRRGGAEL